MKLHIQRHPAIGQSTQQPPIVLLHGWAMNTQAMQPLVAPLQSLGEVWCVDLPGFGASAASDDFAIEAVLTQLAIALPARAIMVGWSLGGVVATAYAAAYPKRVLGLVTLATNACFVAQDDWSTAMAPAVNARFNRAFSADAEGTLSRFCGLVAEGSPALRQRLRQLRALADQLRSCWRQALDYLAQADHRQILQALSQPALHLYAEHDALVPAACAAPMQALNPAHAVTVIEGVGHALHWDAPEQVAARIAEFVCTLSTEDATPRKHRVARSFSRAAPSYDAAARLQREVGSNLLQQLPASAGTVLDLGSGTGYFSAELKQRTAAHYLLSMDIAEGMLRYAREHDSAAADAWVGGDAEALPLQEQSVDLVFSSLAIQWCDNLPRLFAELYRVLKPGASLQLTTLGPGTLSELQQAWRQVDAQVQVNGFSSSEKLEEIMLACGFEAIQQQSYCRTLYSDSVHALSAELKRLGAHQAHSRRSSGLGGRRLLAALEQAYAPFRQPQGLPASYQVIVLSARRGREA